MLIAFTLLQHRQLTLWLAYYVDYIYYVYYNIMIYIYYNIIYYIIYILLYILLYRVLNFNVIHMREILFTVHNTQ